MRPNEDKQKFIELRAQGKSYTAIREELGISKGTCTSWEREFSSEIAQLKNEQLSELYDSYHMTKEARIKKLGDTLASIDAALDSVDFKSLTPEKLLDFKLKYTEALKNEYISPSVPPEPLKKDFEASDIKAAFSDLLNRLQSGTVTPDQAIKESVVLGNLLKAYDAVELKAKIEALERIVGGR